MILKRVSYDESGRPIADWTEGVSSAVLRYSDDYGTNVLVVTFKDAKRREIEPGLIVLREGDGAYLLNDEGKTIEVLSRLHRPT